MARDGDLPSSAPITDRILEIRDRWHTKRHPFFLAFGEGRLPLRALGRYQALHTTLFRGHWRASDCSMRAATSSKTCAR
jgi:hypothetical protein